MLRNFSKTLLLKLKNIYQAKTIELVLILNDYSHYFLNVVNIRLHLKLVSVLLLVMRCVLVHSQSQESVKGLTESDLIQNFVWSYAASVITS